MNGSRIAASLVALGLVACSSPPEQQPAPQPEPPKQQQQQQQADAPQPKQQAAQLPAHPDKLTFPPLVFEPPEPAKFRHELPGGVVAFLIPDHELPLVKVRFSFRGGTYLDPAGKEGLAEATLDQLRKGGAGELSAAAFDEEVDFLAVEMGAGAGEYELTASLDTLAKNLDKALALFGDMLRKPRFEADRFALWKTEVLESMKKRNDDGGDILDREWEALVYGRDHFKARLATKAVIDGLTEEDLRGFQTAVLQPANLVIGVTGDFEPKEMIAKLTKLLEGWPAKERSPLPPVPTHEIQPGVYRVEKDIPQGKVQLGMRSIKRDDPDYHAIMVMSRILGAGGFTSRITSRVRSQEGLAYDAGAAVMPGVWFPGEFQASYQSKNATVALAAKIVLEEIEKIRTTLPEQGELDIAKGSLIETFPKTFESPQSTVSVFVSDTISGRDFSWWKEYREKVRAVTPEDVKRVAQKHLDPAKLALLVVGKWSEIEKGDLEGRAKMAELLGGKSTELPLRDPLTLEPLGGK